MTRHERDCCCEPCWEAFRASLPPMVRQAQATAPAPRIAVVRRARPAPTPQYRPAPVVDRSPAPPLPPEPEPEPVGCSVDFVPCGLCISHDLCLPCVERLGMYQIVLAEASRPVRDWVAPRPAHTVESGAIEGPATCDRHGARWSKDIGGPARD